MDSFEKVKELKSRYKNHLSEQHPDWAESTVSTHVSDAFYIWNNTVLPGFWKVFLSNDTMDSAGAALYHHFRDDVKSSNYEERTQGYFKDLQMLKAYIDNELGGVEKYVGNELWAEEVIYDITRAYYDGKLSEDRALDEPDR